MMRVVRRILRGIAWGVLEGSLIVLVYFVTLPLLVSYAAGGQLDLPTRLTATGMAYIAIVVGLSAAARSLEDTIYEPVLRAASNLYAFIVYVYYSIGRGTVTIEGLEVGEGLVASITLDLTPLALASAVLVLLPGAVIPFIDYYGRSR